MLERCPIDGDEEATEVRTSWLFRGMISVYFSTQKFQEFILVRSRLAYGKSSQARSLHVDKVINSTMLSFWVRTQTMKNSVEKTEAYHAMKHQSGHGLRLLRNISLRRHA